jgi:glycosyltransferase involved in cell wall biosynthesis
MSDVAVIIPVPVGENLTGTTLRAVGIASGLQSRGLIVDLYAPGPSVWADGIQTKQLSDLAPKVAALSAVIAPAGSIISIAALRYSAQLIVDFASPFPIELAGGGAHLRHIKAAEFSSRCAIRAADLVLVAQSRQRNYVQSLVADDERPVPIAEVPFGVPSGRSPARTARQGDAFRMVWPGGMWPWLDPEIVVRSLAYTPSRCSVAFWGVSNSSRIGKQLDRLARSLNVRSRIQFESWIRHDQFFERLASFDIALTFDRGEPERSLAFRTRLLHSLWAGTPTISSGGEWVGDIAARAGAGRACETSPVEIARAITEWSEDPAAVARASDAARDLTTPMTYEATTESLSLALASGIAATGDRSGIGWKSRVRARRLKSGL